MAAAAGRVGLAVGRGAAGPAVVDPVALPAARCGCGGSCDALGDGDLRWRSEPRLRRARLRAPSDRDPDTAVVCAVNLGSEPVRVVDAAPIIASDPLTADGQLPPDVAAWWRV